MQRSGWVQLTPTPRGSLLAYLGIKRRPAARALSADTFAAAIPAPPFMPNGGCIRSTNGGKWEPCPDFERSPLWPGQRVVWKDTIAVDRLPDGRCDWDNSTMKAPAKNLAAMIGERQLRTCRAVVYQIDMVTPPWLPPRPSQ